MRISAITTDPGYTEYAAILPVVFTLDGKVVDLVVTADEEKGEITTYKRGENNRVMKDDKGGGILVTQKGKVVITIQCPTHKSYRAIRRPRCDCQQCKIMWEFLSSK